MTNRLYRSHTNQMIAGVCGGLGEYLRIDANLIRIFCALLVLGSGVGVFLYVILWLIIPYPPEEASAVGDEEERSGADQVAERARSLGKELQEAWRQPSPRALLIAGGVLILLGIMWIANGLHLHWPNFGNLWPLLLIAAGAAMLWRRARGG
jgi:phage shock protein PspC (stress-responsive transcriptional regulator)